MLETAKARADPVGKNGISVGVVVPFELEELLEELVVGQSSQGGAQSTQKVLNFSFRVSLAWTL